MSKAPSISLNFEFPAFCRLHPKDCCFKHSSYYGACRKELPALWGHGLLSCKEACPVSVWLWAGWVDYCSERSCCHRSHMITTSVCGSPRSSSWPVQLGWLLSTDCLNHELYNVSCPDLQRIWLYRTGSRFTKLLPSPLTSALLLTKSRMVPESLSLAPGSDHMPSLSSQTMLCMSWSAWERPGRREGKQRSSNACGKSDCCVWLDMMLLVSQDLAEESLNSKELKELSQNCQDMGILAVSTPRSALLNIPLLSLAAAPALTHLSGLTAGCEPSFPGLSLWHSSDTVPTPFSCLRNPCPAWPAGHSWVTSWSWREAAVIFHSGRKPPQTRAYLCAVTPHASPSRDPAHTVISLPALFCCKQAACHPRHHLWDHLWNIYFPCMQEKRKQNACIILMESLIAKYWIIYSLIVQLILMRLPRLQNAINTFHKIGDFYFRLCLDASVSL